MFQLRSFIHQRLLAAAEEILGEVERTITLAVCDGLRLDQDSLLHKTATIPSLTNSAAALAGEETSTQTSIKEEFNHYPSEPPGLSHNIINTENSHGNQCSLSFSSEIKEEPEENLVDDGQTQEVVLPFPESVKEVRDQPVTPDDNEQWLFASDFSVAKSDNYGSDEARLQRKESQTDTMIWTGKVMQSQCEKSKGVTQTKKVVCKVCCKVFAGRRSLRWHSKIHTGIKDFECPYCGKTFLRKDYLIKHTRTHTGERPHHCDICGKGFISSSHLSRHRRTHTSETQKDPPE